MNIFEFVTQDELDELPEDPNQAFTTFVRHAQRRLGAKTKELDNNDGWEELNEARHGFMNVVVAAAKRYQIEPFSSLEVPRLDDFGAKDHRQFKADLDHYMTQLLLDNSIRGKRDSVLIETKGRDRIRSHVHELRKCVDSSGLPEVKKTALLKRITEFEAELEKRRLNLLAVARVTFELMAVPGGVWSSADITYKLITNVLQTVGEAKAIEDEARRLPPTEAPVALSAPRREGLRAAPASDLDDEIPF